MCRNYELMASRCYGDRCLIKIYLIVTVSLSVRNGNSIISLCMTWNINYLLTLDNLTRLIFKYSLLTRTFLDAFSFFLQNLITRLCHFF